MKPDKNWSLEDVLQEYVSIQLDSETPVSEGQKDHDQKRLKDNNERFSILVTGHGTGKS
jgi:hypothetical protein